MTEFYGDQGAVRAETDEAVRCLRELAARDGLLELAGREAARRLLIDSAVTPSDRGGYRAVTVTGPGSRVTRAGICNLDQWRVRRESLGQPEDLTEPQVDDAVTQAAAHEALGNDLLCTTNQFLLRNRDHPAMRHLNIWPPPDVCRVVGLLHRSRDNYAVNDYFSVDREGFYWPLMRNRLPAMWRYFSACVYSEKARKDDILYLGQSILNRSKWALEARDDIGAQFYRKQHNATSDRMTYHVGYLVTLLMGAFDGAARVAVRAYGVQIEQARVRFRNPALRRSLREAGATQLADLLESERFLDTTQILNTARNAIHGTGHTPLAYVREGEPQQSLVKVPSVDAEAMLSAFSRLADSEEWGFQQVGDLCFEPYTFSLAACRRSFELLNEVAEATDVHRLFPIGTHVTTKNHPPADWDDPPGFLARLDALG